MSRDIKVINFPAKEESEGTKKQRAQMIQMLEEVLQGVKDGKITGYVFVGRKKPGVGKAVDDYFEYILANALDIGLIGEVQVINNRLIHYYDQYTDSATPDDPDWDEGE